MRILSIDYGTKRTGIAVTDPMQMIATGLTTLHSKDAVDFIEKYLAKENVETIVIGEPKTLQNKKSDSEMQIVPFINRLKKKFPQLKIERYDERYTSKIAFQSLIDSGLKKKQRQDKKLVDVTSAVLILQSYLESKEKENNRQ